MEKTAQHKPKIPLTEKLKTLPDIFGIRLNEQPQYEIVRKDGDIQLRKYNKSLIAQVTVAGEYEDAVKNAFKVLADFIFGGNKSESTIEMTSPVFQEQRHQAWTLSFIMPEKFNLASIPQPINPKIKLLELPSRTTAVIEYSGNNNEEKMMQAEQDLKAWLYSEGMTPKSETRWAQYDPPFTVPFLKKNEAHIDVFRF